eukprot:2059927-Alexandrium_andersonii.AAC.1
MLQAPANSGLQQGREALRHPQWPHRAGNPGMRSRERPNTQTFAGLSEAAPHGADPPHTGA